MTSGFLFFFYRITPPDSTEKQGGTMSNTSVVINQPTRLERVKRAFLRWWPLYLMLIPGILYFAIYKYAPLSLIHI